MDLFFKDFEAVELSHFGKEKSNFFSMIGIDVVNIAIVETDFFLNLNTDIVSIRKVHDVSVLFDTLNDVFAGNVHSANIAGTINDFVIFKRERFAIFFSEGVSSDEQDWIIEINFDWEDNQGGNFAIYQFNDSRFHDTGSPLVNEEDFNIFGAFDFVGAFSLMNFMVTSNQE